MKPPMIHRAYKVTTTRDFYGGYTAGSETALNCHVRIITGTINSIGNEQYDCDALMWFEPDSGVTKNDIIKFEGQHYMVDSVVEARRLRNPTILFLKCQMIKYGVIS